MILQSDNPYLNGIRVSPLLGTALFCVAAFGAWFLLYVYRGLRPLGSTLG